MSSTKAAIRCLPSWVTLGRDDHEDERGELRGVPTISFKFVRAHDAIVAKLTELS